MSKDPKLPPYILSLLNRILDNLPAGISEVLAKQVERARLVDETPGRWARFAVPEEVEKVVLPDGPLREIPAIVDSNGTLTGELIVWVTGGRISDLERPWYTDQAPDSWPDPENLDFSQ